MSTSALVEPVEAVCDAEGGAASFSSLSVITAEAFSVCVHDGAGEGSMVNLGLSCVPKKWYFIGEGQEVQVDSDVEIYAYRAALSVEEKRLKSKKQNDARARSRLRRYFKKNGLGKMWTLTFAEATFDRSYVHSMVNEFVSRWRSSAGGEAFPYAYVLELHPEGHGLHVHFATRPGFVSWAALGLLWG